MTQQLITATTYLQQLIYRIYISDKENPIRTVCVADTHSREVTVPPGDLLIHAGDLTRSGQVAELQAAIAWLNSHPHKYKIAIGGNADLPLDIKLNPAADKIDWGDVIYRCGSSVSLKFDMDHDTTRTLVVYGNPYVPRCGADGEEAFQYELDEDYWRDAIPSDADVVVTHTPPKHILDQWDGNPEGCPSLYREIQRISPKLHVFGHVHPGYGRELVIWDTVSYESHSLRHQFHEMKNTDGRISRLKMFSLLIIRMLICLMISIVNIFPALRRKRSGRKTIFVNAAAASPDGTYMKNSPVVVDL